MGKIFPNKKDPKYSLDKYAHGRAVAGLVCCEGAFLFLKRSKKARNWPLAWNIVSGIIEANEDSDTAIKREVKQETGLKVRVKKHPKPYHAFGTIRGGKISFDQDGAADTGVSFDFDLFLCESKSKEVELNDENTDYKWVNKGQIKDLIRKQGIGKAPLTCIAVELLKRVVKL